MPHNKSYYIDTVKTTECFGYLRVYKFKKKYRVMIYFV